MKKLRGAFPRERFAADADSLAIMAALQPLGMVSKSAQAIIAEVKGVLLVHVATAPEADTST